ncbi:MAG: aminotransferase class V-fold PLP-dependent enzyme [Chloroflexi bacterium]|nr:aminotransferase class V-fold PLP-dependent enzyme [Chloroflexota bacterium]
MSHYDALGIRPIINANATLTKLGGSLMPPEVLRAMNEAAGCFIDLPLLQRRVGERIADLTRNEAAYVTSGAAAGVMLAATACVLYHHPEVGMDFPQIASLKNEAIVHRNQRNGYDFAVQQTGMRFVEIDPTPTALRDAINEKTACIFWFAGRLVEETDTPLQEVIAIADEHKLPVVVDAAAQLPPPENLWRFTEMGAALALFSGGKDLRGPQPTGLMLGRRDMIESIRVISVPNHGLGRPLKVGKEEMMGLLAAVERYLEMDHAAREAYCEDCVRLWRDALNPLPGVCAEHDFPNEANQPLPWCLISVDPDVLGRSASDLVAAFLEGEPAISVFEVDETRFRLNPMTLNPGEEFIVRDVCLKLLVPA